MKVYVLTSGSYSDYRIEAVYSMSELAERAKTVLGYDSDVKEYVVDEVILKAAHVYSVQISYDGQVVRAADKGGFPGTEFVSSNGETLFTDVWADNKEHAIKIANERRTAAILDGRLKTGHNP